MIIKAFWKRKIYFKTIANCVFSHQTNLLADEPFMECNSLAYEKLLQCRVESTRSSNVSRILRKTHMLFRKHFCFLMR